MLSDYSFLYTCTITWPIHFTCKMNLVTDARLVFVVYCWLNTCHRKLTTNSIVNINVQESQNSVYMAVVWLKCIQSVKWRAGMANIERYTTQVLRNSRNSKLFPLSTVLILCCFLTQEYWLMYWCTVEIELSSNVILFDLTIVHVPSLCSH